MRIKDDFSSLLQNMLAFFGTRASLFGIEFSQEKKRFASVAIWAVLVLFFMGFAFLMLNIGVLVYFWDTPYRGWSVLGLLAFYLLVALVGVMKLRHHLKTEAFPYTKVTLKQDLAYFQDSGQLTIKEGNDE